jgi:predicted anti-sigma-YlaC factor YlaD
MEKSCRKIEEMLVDYTDGQLSPDDSSKVAEHLAQCEACRKVLEALRKSLDLAGVVWTDGLSETETIRIPTLRKVRKLSRYHYAAIAASILLVVTASIVWRALMKPEPTEVTFAEIERQITESASAARLLAATELLAEVPDVQPIVDQQYRYIVETYPETTAANKAKSKMKIDSERRFENDPH